MSGEPLRSVLRADEPATLIESGRIAASLFDEPVAAQHSNNEARFYLLANGTIVALPYADPPLAWADAAQRQSTAAIAIVRSFMGGLLVVLAARQGKAPACCNANIKPCA